MPSSNPSDPKQPRPDRSGLLNSWKEIAACLNRSVVTVRRWEKSKGLPVHRDERQSPVRIYAYRSELEQWGRTGAGAPSDEVPVPLNPPPLPPSAPGRLEAAPEQATAPPPLGQPTAEVELPPVDYRLRHHLLNLKGLGPVCKSSPQMRPQMKRRLDGQES